MMSDTSTITDRRADALAGLSAIEREQGVALLDGGETAPLAILAARSELAVLDAAEAEAVRRQREAEEAEQTKARAELAATAKIELEAFGAAVAAADDHARNLAASLAAIREHGRELKLSARALGLRASFTLDPGLARQGTEPGDRRDPVRHRSTARLRSF